MADDTTTPTITPTATYDPVNSFKWGELNPVLKQISGLRMSEGDPLKVLRRSNMSLYEQNILGGVKHFKAIVLRVDSPGPNAQSVDGAHTVLKADENNGQDIDKPVRMVVRAAIPEIHGAILPKPAVVVHENPAAIDHGVIDMYPAFVAKDPLILQQGVPKPGDIVWVDFGNRDNLQDPLYLGPFEALVPLPQMPLGTDMWGNPCVVELPALSKVSPAGSDDDVNVPTSAHYQKGGQSVSTANEQAEVDALESQRENIREALKDPGLTPEQEASLLEEMTAINSSIESLTQKIIDQKEKEQKAAAQPMPCTFTDASGRPGPPPLPNNVEEFVKTLYLPGSSAASWSAIKETRVRLQSFGPLPSSVAGRMDAAYCTGGPLRGHKLAIKRFQYMAEAFKNETGASTPLKASNVHRPGGMEKYDWLFNAKSYKSKKIGGKSPGSAGLWNSGGGGTTGARENYERAFAQNNSRTEENCFRLFCAALIDDYGSLERGFRMKAFRGPHETGLAFDIGNHGLSATSSGAKGIPYQKQQPAFKWLVKNAWRWGFYPYKNETWHWEFLPTLKSYITGVDFVTNDDPEGGEGSYGIYIEETLTFPGYDIPGRKTSSSFWSTSTADQWTSRGQKPPTTDPYKLRKSFPPGQAMSGKILSSVLSQLSRGRG